MVTTLHSNPAIGYGVLIFLGFSVSLSVRESPNMPGRRSATTFNTTLRMDATLPHRHGGVVLRPATDGPDHVGSFQRVNQLEDVVSDSSTSIIRIVITFATAFLILVLMSKLAAVLFTPLLFIVPAVYWFSTRSPTQVPQTARINGRYSTPFSRTSFPALPSSKPTTPKSGKRTVSVQNRGPIETKPWVQAKTATASSR